MSDVIVGGGGGGPGGPPALRPPRNSGVASGPGGDADGEPRPPGPGPADGAVLDPRMVARRVAVRRDEGRRRLRRLFTVLAVAGVVGLAALLTRTPLLDIDHVRVVGADAALRSAVLDAVDAAGAGPGTPLLDVDAGAVAAAVESVPTVASAEVTKSWPDTLTVQVSPRIPVARVGGALVAEDGLVLAVGSAAGSPPLVDLDGVQVPTEAGARIEAPDLLTVVAALPEEVRAAVAAVRAAPADGGVDLRLSGGGIARLGPTTGLGAKLVAIATVLEQVDLTCLATIDVRILGTDGDPSVRVRGMNSTRTRLDGAYGMRFTAPRVQVEGETWTTSTTT